MPEAQPKLDSLPVEVIRRIAASGTCVEALNLMKVNHRLFSSCRDWSVFQHHILENHDGLVKQPKWDISFLTPQIHADTWARYALADQRIGEFLSQKELPVKLGRTPITTYIPQLVVTHHPLMNLQAVESLSWLYFSAKVSDSHGLALAFTITACVLSELQAEDMTDAARVECYKSLTGYNTTTIKNEYSLALCLWHALPIPSIRGAGDIPGTNLAGDPFSDKTLLRAYLVLPFFYYELKMALEVNNFFHPEGADEADLPAQLPIPPISAKIPFSSFMYNMPQPFSQISPALFTASHIPLMASASFLTSGTWAGYLYTNTSHISNSPRFQYPMFSVQFHTHIEANLPHEVFFTTTGKMFTAKGSFEWNGSIDSRTGKIDIDARYHDDTWMIPLRWQAVMTPFGIVGSMGGERNAHWMWMWKEEWCTRD